MEKLEKIVEQGLLYDFYGDLLTDHQRKIYEDAVYNDMSLNEIAEEQGISKQGVHDLIKRCTRSLEEYESRLHMVKKSADIRKTVQQLLKVAADDEISKANLVIKVREISEIILEELS